MFDLKRIRTIESEWESIEESFRLAQYNAPLNREQERQKVFDFYTNGQHYNPQFIYPKPPEFPSARIRDFINRLVPDQSLIEMLYYEKAQRELWAIQRVETHSPDIITGSSCLVYGLPDCELLAKAQAILAKPPVDTSVQDKTVPAEEAAMWMQSALNRLGFQEWKATVFNPMNAKMSVNCLDKLVKIRGSSIFTQDEIRRLLAHEIGVHVLRYENGYIQPIRLFSNSFPKCVDTEEGLAIYNEEQSGLLQEQTLRKYAGRVIAAHLALNQPFSEVFKVIAETLGPELAYEVVVRAKRGFTDTAQPGAHTKDIVYLQGYLRVKTHLEQYPDDYSLLFTGKIGIQHLSLVKSLIDKGIISLPTLLPKHLTELDNDLILKEGINES